MRRRSAADHSDQIERLLGEANSLPHGATRIELCEEAARIADAHGDLGLAYRARDQLVEAACYGARPDLMIVAFSWCLSTYDRHPEQDISEYVLLWRMKWVIGSLANFPDIDGATIQRMLDDMERRFRAYGGSIQPVLGKRRSIAAQHGNHEAAREAHQKFQKLPRTLLSDCHACEMRTLGWYYLEIGKLRLGIRKTEEVIASGMTCARVPNVAFASLLLPLLEVGRAEEAMKYHKQGYPMIAKDADYLWSCGEHMSYLALTGNDARAIKLMQTHFPALEASYDPLASLGFLRNALLTLECLAERKDRIKLRLPSDSPLANESGEYVLTDLVVRTRERVLELSRRFDTRNGNGHFVGLLNELPKLRKKAVRVSLS
jgi:hypothetical protein